MELILIQEKFGKDMNLLFEVNSRLDKYKVSLIETPNKADIIQKEIDFLMKIKNDFIEIKDSMIDFRNLVFYPDIDKPVFEDLQGVELKLKDKYPNFDPSALRNKAHTIDIIRCMETLVELNRKTKSKKEYFLMQNNSLKVKECENDEKMQFFLLNQFSTMIHLVQICKFSLEFSFHIELIKLFL